MLNLPEPDKAVEGQESVWDYPRPPALELVNRHVRVVFNGQVIAESRSPVLVKETSHPPVYFIQPEDVRTELLHPSFKVTTCEWKGQSVYFDLVMKGQTLKEVAFSYPSPVPRFEMIRDWFSFYAGPMDEVTVDGERVKPQEGSFYSGWITSHVVGPFKGAPGTWGW
jgi:uncharacterized protein (DUF427 family)